MSSFFCFSWGDQLFSKFIFKFLSVLFLVLLSIQVCVFAGDVSEDSTVSITGAPLIASKYTLTAGGSIDFDVLLQNTTGTIEGVLSSDIRIVETGGYAHGGSLSDSGGGVYEATISLTEAREYNFQVMYISATIGSIFTVTVNPKAASLASTDGTQTSRTRFNVYKQGSTTALSTGTGSGLIVGDEVSVRLWIQDEYGNDISISSNTVVLELTEGGATTNYNFIENGAGYYEASARVTKETGSSFDVDFIGNPSVVAKAYGVLQNATNEGGSITDDSSSALTGLTNNELVAGENVSFKVDLIDRYGNVINGSTAEITNRITIVETKSYDTSGITFSESSSTDGEYTGSIQLTEAGEYNFQAMYDNVELGSVLTMTVIPKDASLLSTDGTQTSRTRFNVYKQGSTTALSEGSGSGLIVGDEVSVRLWIQDEYGNDISISSNTVVLELTEGGATTNYNFIENGAGYYEASARVTKETGSSFDVDFIGNPSVVAKAYGVLQNATNEGGSITDDSSSALTGLTNNELVAGENVSFKVDLIDRYGNVINGSTAEITNRITIVETKSYDTSGITFSESSSTDGEYTGSIQLTEAGEYNFQAMYDNVELGSVLTMTVIPKDASLLSTDGTQTSRTRFNVYKQGSTTALSEGSGSGLIVGDEVSVRLWIQDEYGNDISISNTVLELTEGGATTNYNFIENGAGYYEASARVTKETGSSFDVDFIGNPSVVAKAYGVLQNATNEGGSITDDSSSALTGLTNNELVAGENVSFKVDLIDRYGNVINGSTAEITNRITIVETKSYDTSGITFSESSSTDGEYTGSIQLTEAGEYNFQAMYDNVELGSVLTMTVIPKDASLLSTDGTQTSRTRFNVYKQGSTTALSEGSGSGLIVGDEVSVRLWIQDEYGNDISISSNTVVLELTEGGATTNYNFIENGAGYYEASARVTKETGSSFDVDFIGNPSVVAKAYGVLQNATNEGGSITDDSSSALTGLTNNELVAGENVSFKVDLIDRYGNVINGSTAEITNRITIVETKSYDTSGITFSESSSTDGEYTGSIQLTEAGEYNFQAMYDNVELGSVLTMTVIPKDASLLSTDGTQTSRTRFNVYKQGSTTALSEGSGSGLIVGDEVSVRLWIQDEYGNDISISNTVLELTEGGATTNYNFIENGAGYYEASARVTKETGSSFDVDFIGNPSVVAKAYGVLQNATNEGGSITDDSSSALTGLTNNELVAGGNVSFKVDLIDRYENVINGDITAITNRIKIVETKSYDTSGITFSESSSTDGEYTGSIQLTEAGEYNFQAMYDNVELGNVLTMTVIPKVASLESTDGTTSRTRFNVYKQGSTTALSEGSGSGLIVGDEVSVRLWIQDEYGNDISISNTVLELTEGGATINYNFIENGAGYYEASAQVTKEAGSSFDVDFIGNPSVVAKAYGVLQNATNEGGSITDDSSSALTGLTNNELVAGGNVSFKVDLIDRYENVINGDITAITNRIKIVETKSYDTSGITFSESSSTDGEYTGSIQLTEAGEYNFQAMYDNVELGSVLTMTVIPKDASLLSTDGTQTSRTRFNVYKQGSTTALSEGSGSGLIVGDEVSVRLWIQDEYGNDISISNTVLELTEGGATINYNFIENGAGYYEASAQVTKEAGSSFDVDFIGNPSVVAKAYGVLQNATNEGGSITDDSSSALTGLTNNELVAGGNVSFKVDLIDRYENVINGDITAITNRIKIVETKSYDTSGITFSESSSTDGEYTGSIQLTEAGEYNFQAMYDNVELGSVLTMTVIPKVASLESTDGTTSRTRFNVYKQGATTALSEGSGSGLIVGDEVSVRLWIQDEYGNDISISNTVLELTEGGATTNYNFIENGAGYYEASAQVTKETGSSFDVDFIGNPSVVAKAYGVLQNATNEGGSITDDSSSALTGLTNNELVAGGNVSFKVDLIDRYENVINGDITAITNRIKIVETKSYDTSGITFSESSSTDGEYTGSIQLTEAGEYNFQAMYDNVELGSVLTMTVIPKDASLESTDGTTSRTRFNVYKQGSTTALSEGSGSGLIVGDEVSVRLWIQDEYGNDISISNTVLELTEGGATINYNFIENGAGYYEASAQVTKETGSSFDVDFIGNPSVVAKAYGVLQNATNEGGSITDDSSSALTGLTNNELVAGGNVSFKVDLIDRYENVINGDITAITNRIKIVETKSYDTSGITFSESSSTDGEYTGSIQLTEAGEYNFQAMYDNVELGSVLTMIVIPKAASLESTDGTTSRTRFNVYKQGSTTALSEGSGSGLIVGDEVSVRLWIQDEYGNDISISNTVLELTEGGATINYNFIENGAGYYEASARVTKEGTASSFDVNFFTATVDPGVLAKTYGVLQNATNEGGSITDYSDSALTGLTNNELAAGGTVSFEVDLIDRYGNVINGNTTEITNRIKIVETKSYDTSGITFSESSSTDGEYTGSIQLTEAGEYNFQAMYDNVELGSVLTMIVIPNVASLASTDGTTSRTRFNVYKQGSTTALSEGSGSGLIVGDEVSVRLWIQDEYGNDISISNTVLELTEGGATINYNFIENGAGYYEASAQVTKEAGSSFDVDFIGNPSVVAKAYGVLQNATNEGGSITDYSDSDLTGLTNNELVAGGNVSFKVDLIDRYENVINGDITAITNRIKIVETKSYDTSGITFSESSSTDGEYTGSIQLTEAGEYNFQAMYDNVELGSVLTMTVIPKAASLASTDGTSRTRFNVYKQGATTALSEGTGSTLIVGDEVSVRLWIQDEYGNDISISNTVLELTEGGATTNYNFIENGAGYYEASAQVTKEAGSSFDVDFIGNPSVVAKAYDVAQNNSNILGRISNSSSFELENLANPNEIVAGNEIVLRITLMDEYGNTIEGLGSRVVIKEFNGYIDDFNAAGAENGRPAHVYAKYYSANQMSIAQEYDFQAYYDNVAVGTVIKVRVIPDEVDVSNSSFHIYNGYVHGENMISDGSAYSVGEIFNRLVFRVILRDRFNNILNSDQEETVTLSVGDSSGQTNAYKRLGLSTNTFNYASNFQEYNLNANPSKIQNEIYTVRALYNSSAINAGTSDDTINFSFGSSVVSRDRSSTVFTGYDPSNAVVLYTSQALNIKFNLRDTRGYAISTHSFADSFAVNLNFDKGDGSPIYSTDLLKHATLSSSEFGNYNVDFVLGRDAANDLDLRIPYKVYVSIDGNSEGTIIGSVYSVLFNPSQPSAQKSFVVFGDSDGASLTTSSHTFTIDVVLKDEYGFSYDKNDPDVSYDILVDAPGISTSSVFMEDSNGQYYHRLIFNRTAIGEYEFRVYLDNQLLEARSSIGSSVSTNEKLFSVIFEVSDTSLLSAFTSVTIDEVFITSASLSWEDNFTSESGYVVVSTDFEKVYARFNKDFRQGLTTQQMQPNQELNLYLVAVQSDPSLGDEELLSSLKDMQSTIQSYSEFTIRTRLYPVDNLSIVASDNLNELNSRNTATATWSYNDNHIPYGADSISYIVYSSTDSNFSPAITSTHSFENGATSGVLYGLIQGKTNYFNIISRGIAGVDSLKRSNNENVALIPRNTLSASLSISLSSMSRITLVASENSDIDIEDLIEETGYQHTVVGDSTVSYIYNLVLSGQEVRETLNVIAVPRDDYVDVVPRYGNSEINAVRVHSKQEVRDSVSNSSISFPNYLAAHRSSVTFSYGSEKRELLVSAQGQKSIQAKLGSSSKGFGFKLSSATISIDIGAFKGSVDVMISTSTREMDASSSNPASFFNSLHFANSYSIDSLQSVVEIQISTSDENYLTKPLTLEIEEDNNDNSQQMVIVRETSSGKDIPYQTYYNSNTGFYSAYIGDSGKYLLKSVSPQKQLDPDEILIYPNPYRTAYDFDNMKFDNLPNKTSVSIYTFSGELVIKLEVKNDGVAYWDGRNSRGLYVASGVYIATMTMPNSDDGMIIRRKIAIER